MEQVERKKHKNIFDTLQIRVTLLFLLMSLVPLGLISLLSLRIAQEIIISQVSNQLDNLAKDKVNLLNRWLSERDSDLRVMAESSQVQNLDPIGIDQYLEIVRRNYRVYDEIVVVRSNGQPASRGPYQNSDYQSQPWFQEALTGKNYRSPIMLLRDHSGSVFWISKPIRHQNGEIIGAVAARVNTGSILSDILHVSLGRTGESYLVDRTGVFLAHRDPPRILSENISQSGSFKKMTGESEARNSYLDYRGILVLGASRQVIGTDWYLVVEQDWEEAFAGLARLRRYLLSAIVVSFFGSILIASIFAWYVVGPIKRLRRAADALEKGKFEASLVHIGRKDEIGDLYQAFLTMAKELRSRETSLEQKVDQKEIKLQEASRTLEQTRAVVARAQQLAALGRLAAGVTHEIRTPLTSLKLYLQSMGGEVEFSDEGQEDYRIALNQISRMEATINRFLNFAKPQEPVLACLDVPSLIEDSLMIVEPRAKQEEIRVERQLAPDLPSLKGDRRQVEEMLLNLMINAIEAMSKGDLLTISASEMKRGEGKYGQSRWLKITVSDTGEGIAPESLEKVFDPFFTTKSSGTGLGLSVVHQTAIRHGGELFVESQLGQGTTFTILLPACVEE